MLVSLILIPGFQVKAETTTITSGDNVNTIPGYTALTQSEITSAWPNLPTAQQLYYSGGASTIDTSTLGQVESANLPNTSLSTAVNLSYMISNCTSTGITSYGVIQNDPHIWLQYNSTIWVEVPLSYLNTTVQPYATAIQQAYAIGSEGPYPFNATASQNSSASQNTVITVNAPTWAIGEYDDPSTISGSSTNVMGAVSYGYWSCYPPNTLSYNSAQPNFIMTDILSATTVGGIGLQVFMDIANFGSGTQWYVSVNVWQNGVCSPGIAASTLGLLRLQLTQHTTNSLNTTQAVITAMFWNFVNLGWVGPISGTSSQYLLTGNEPHVAIESDDTALADFNNHQDYYTAIGGASTND